MTLNEEPGNLAIYITANETVLKCIGRANGYHKMQVFTPGVVEGGPILFYDSNGFDLSFGNPQTHIKKKIEPLLAPIVN